MVPVDDMENTMIPVITPGLATEYDTFRFVVEASDLRLAPGEYPVRLETTLGNGLPFFYEPSLSTPGGDPVYRQSGGALTLRVLND